MRTTVRARQTLVRGMGNREVTFKAGLQPIAETGHLYFGEKRTFLLCFETAGLRVVDASVMPSTPRANTNLPCTM
jgi:hypothetical protein